MKGGYMSFIKYKMKYLKGNIYLIQAVKVYERCLIPCANYPEFWMRYVEFMESKGGREIAKFALERSTRVFLKVCFLIYVSLIL